MSSGNEKTHSLTHMGNTSFDETNQLNTFEISGVDENGVARIVPLNTDGTLKSSVPAGAATSTAQTDGSQKTQNTEDTLLLRKIVKLLESSAVVDIANRQKVTVEGATITSGTITTVSTVSTVSNLALIASLDPRFQIMDIARQAYNSSIRSNLAFT